MGSGAVAGALAGLGTAQLLALTVAVVWATQEGLGAALAGAAWFAVVGGLVGTAIGMVIGSALGAVIGGLRREADAPVITAALLIAAVGFLAPRVVEAGTDAATWIPIAVAVAAILGVVGWLAGRCFEAWTALDRVAERPA